MPELPEVESLRRGLAPKVRGRRIESIELRLPKQVRRPSPSQFESSLPGRRIVGVSRRGKFLLLKLDHGTLAVHLGMSGQLTYWDHRRKDGSFAVHPLTGLQRVATQHKPDKHTHLLLHLDGGDRLQYRDIRQFGQLLLFEPGELERHAPIARLGLEPLQATFCEFFAAVRGKRSMLKAMLLSQRPVAGLGNIYADEALWRARLHPSRHAETLRPRQWKALHRAIRSSLLQGIRNRGTTLMDYRDAEGRPGGNRERLQAYGRGGLPCRRCGRMLVKILVSQRTTVFCPRCQRLPQHPNARL